MLHDETECSNLLALALKRADPFLFNPGTTFSTFILLYNLNQVTHCLCSNKKPALKFHFPFRLWPKTLFFKKKRRKKKQEIFYNLKLHLQISLRGLQGQGGSLGRTHFFFFLNHLCTARASGWGRGRPWPDSQSKRRECHTQLRGHGTRRADRFLQRVFRPRGNSQGDRTAKQGQVTVWVKATERITKIIFFPRNCLIVHEWKQIFFLQTCHKMHPYEAQTQWFFFFFFYG